MKSQTLVGIDEAGRGPLAGPVAVGVFVVSSREILKQFRGVKDSKQLSERQREEWFKVIEHTIKCKVKSSKSKVDHNRRLIRKSNQARGDVSVYVPNIKWQVAYAVSFSSPAIIDKYGISFAIRSAMNNSLKKLEKKGYITSDSKILLDGSLKAPDRFKDQKTIIDGDAKEPVIALASICAKVLRDRQMKKIAKRYPQYGFEIHKGYDTMGHYKALKKYGLTPIHRRSFLKKIQ